MQIPSLNTAPTQIAPKAAAPEALQGKTAAPDKLHETFDSFVGETFYGQMLSAMRKTVHKAPYFDGGRAEEVFRGQLDQVMAKDLAARTPPSFSEPLFQLFALQQR